MLITTAEAIPDRAIVKTIGLVRGSSIRTRHILTDIAEWIRNLVGAELHHYTKMLAECREQALDRMIEDARRQGANAIIGVEFETSSIASGAAEILAYGTAVVIE
ncbi:MAG: YbjQ family protein [Planctomycetes bacterium]|nr:YbjQ family protein [Planctomycetota bacterium]